MENIKKAYDEIFEVLERHKDVCVFDVADLKRKSAFHLFGLKLKDEYGLNIDPKIIHNLEWQSLGEFASIGWFGEKYNKPISWSDDGSQPEDELLLRISFPTGAYIFGEDYPTELFHKLFMELTGYAPKYCDSHNKSLYFSMNNARGVFNSFNEIMAKYRKLNQEDAKRRKIERLKKDLEKLEK